MNFETKVSSPGLSHDWISRYKNTLLKIHADWLVFKDRLLKYFPEYSKLLYPIYGDRYDWLYHLEELLYTLAENWINRSTELKKLDLPREIHPTWFQSENIVGGVCYVDLVFEKS